MTPLKNNNKSNNNNNNCTQEWPRLLFSCWGTECQLNTKFQSKPERE